MTQGHAELLEALLLRMAEALANLQDSHTRWINQTWARMDKLQYRIEALEAETRTNRSVNDE